MFQTKDTPPDYREDLTPEEKKIIREWVFDSKPFNTSLRYNSEHEYFDGKYEKFEKCLADAMILSSVIEKSKLDQGYDVQRGLGPFDIKKIKGALEERNQTGLSPILYDNGFTAVSFNEKISYEFADYDECGEKYILSASLHSGDTALFIGDENPTHNRKQGEILLPPKTGYYVTNIRRALDDQGSIIHFVDVVFVRSRGLP